MDAVYSRPKIKRTIQTVTSNKPKSQALSWYQGCVIPFANVTYTFSERAERFWSSICCLQDDIFSRDIHAYCNPTVAHLKTCRKNGTKWCLKRFITWCLRTLNVVKVLWKGLATLQSGKCFTVPILFQICYKNQNWNKCLFWKNNTIYEVKHQIMCFCIVFIVREDKDHCQF